MKVTTDPSKTPIQATGAATRTEQAAGASIAARPKTAASGKSNVDISDAALQLSNLHLGDNDVNVERVKEIRAALQAGTLKIDTSRIADGLIASARELLK